MPRWPERTLAERFWEKVARAPGDGCWEWIASTANGYGQFRIATNPRRPSVAHRVAWELERGPVPAGLCVLHRCDNRRCVRVGHLFLGTVADNARDCADKGRQANSKRTHCPRGHPFSGDNLKIVMKRNGRRRRYCRTCSIRATRRWRLERRREGRKA